MTPSIQWADRSGRRLGAAGALLAAISLFLAFGGASAISGTAELTSELRWYASALAVSGAVLAWSALRGAATFGVLSAAFLAGGAAHLYLTEPLWFPQLRLKPNGLDDLAMIAVLATQAALTLVAARHIGRRQLVAFVRERAGLGLVLAVIVMGGLFSVSVMGAVRTSHWQGWSLRILGGTALVALHLATLSLACAANPPARLATPGMRALPAAALTLVASLLLASLAFQDIPHVEDEVAYIFQARTMAEGALWAPAPPEAIQPGLEYYLLDIRDGRWFASTAPGWPAVLAAGTAAGVPWLVNPILAAVSVLIGAAIAARWADAATARVVAILMATSPWFIAAAATYMTHALSIALNLAAWWAVTKGEEDGRMARWSFPAGLAMGWIFTTRPLDGFLLGVLTGLWILLSRRGGVVAAAMFGVGCVLTGSLYLAFNAALSGDPFVTPLAQHLAEYWGPGANSYGFGAGIGPTGGWGALDLAPGHSPFEAIVNTLNNLAALNFEFLGWSIGSLALLVCAVVLCRHDRFDRAMWLVFACVVAALALYWFAGSFYLGPRYWFPAFFALIYLAARGYCALAARVGEPGRLAWGLAMLCLFGLCVFLPWRGVTKYHEFGNYDAIVREAKSAGDFGDAVVLVAPDGNFGSAFVLNDPWLRPGHPVFVADTGKLDRDAIARAFPGRSVIDFSPDRDARE
ncbi:MAG: hypothetical protein MUE79_07830 [Nitratireductor sp.]|nr:hypothetical protein [Nitratireductor sp.]